jgi:mannose-1-phosphate guanylyltransferase
MNYTIILAGGTGSRFWPLSRAMEPKQFLNVCSNKPMIEETVFRIGNLFKKENIYIATNKAYGKKIKAFVRTFRVPWGNILFEPEARNTLAPIGALSKQINNNDPQAVIVVLPSDHLIRDADKFRKALSRGIELAKDGDIVTLGINPDRPETGYGYIKIKAKNRKIKKITDYCEVDRFVEKPDLVRAKRFIKDKRYYWNSGIFIFRSEVILSEIREFVPQAYKTIMKIKDKADINKLWPKLPNISFDYAIMQKTKKTVLLPAEYGWMDLGCWEAIETVVKKDSSGNVLKGNCIDIGSKNILVWSDKRLVATIGLENIIIVDTKDALLVCTKDKAQDVKKIVQALKEKNLRGHI